MLRRTTLAPPSRDARLLHASATAANEAIALWSSDSRPAHWTITRQLDAALQSIELDAHRGWRSPIVQAMPDGGALVANTRCQWSGGLLEHNARHVDANGEFVRSATLGDGIAHMLTDTVGNVWVGFFDEGVFGTVGWTEDGAGAAPIGGPGLLRFDSDLTLAWSYSARESKHYIDDCYALNVTDKAVVTCCYSDFVIARVVSGEIEYWDNSFKGADAVLVDGDNCALIGGYGSQKYRVVEGVLGPHGFESRRIDALELVADELVGRQVWKVSRGSELHVFDNLDWYRWTLDGVPIAQAT